MAKLYFKYGAMGSGKSAALMQVAYNYDNYGMNVIVLKPAIDTKGASCLVSRIGISRKVDALLGSDTSVYDVVNLDDNIQCILVDECQFLTEQQAFELFEISKINDIPVICYGLKTNFKGKLFSGSKAIFELADDIEELVTICECGKKARFNMRKINGEYTVSGEEVVIDGSKNVEYVPSCGSCYIKRLKKVSK